MVFEASIVDPFAYDGMFAECHSWPYPQFFIRKIRHTGVTEFSQVFMCFIIVTATTLPFKLAFTPTSQVPHNRTVFIPDSIIRFFTILHCRCLRAITVEVELLIWLSYFLSPKQFQPSWVQHTVFINKCCVVLHVFLDASLDAIILQISGVQCMCRGNVFYIPARNHGSIALIIVLNSSISISGNM